MSDTQPDAPPPMMDLLGIGSNLTGYKNFFEYGYELSGFEDDGTERCTYPTNEDRYNIVETLQTTLAQQKNEQFLDMIERAFGLHYPDDLVI